MAKLPKKLDQLTSFSPAKTKKSSKKRIKAEGGLTLADLEIDKQFRDENDGRMIKSALMPKGIGAEGEYMDQMFQSDNVQKGKVAKVLSNPNTLPTAKYMDPLAPSAKDLQRIDGSFSVPKTTRKQKNRPDLVGWGLAALPALADKLFPDDPNRQYIRPEDTPYYNPYPQGTGSQAIMKKGGTVVSGTGIKFPEGGEVDPVTGKPKKKPMMMSATYRDVNWAPQSLSPEFTRTGDAKVMDPMTQKLLDDQAQQQFKQQKFFQQNPNINMQQYATQQQQLQGSVNRDGDFVPNANYRQPGRLVTTAPTTSDIAANNYTKQFENGGPVQDSTGLYRKKMINALNMEFVSSGGLKKAFREQAEKASSDLQRQSNKGKKGYDKNGFPVKARTGGQIRQNSEYEVGGEMALYDDRTGAQPISDNPYSSEIVEFKGPSHEEGGIPMSYTGKQVEVEGGETAFKDVQGNLQILGNMKNPLTGRLFKNDGKMIAKEERKASNQMGRGNELVAKSDPNDPFERLTFNSGKAKMQGADAKMQKLATIREAMATVQQEKLRMADKLGIKPLDMDKAKYGKMITAEDGIKVYKNIKPWAGDKYSGVKNASAMKVEDIQNLVKMTGYTGKDNTKDFQKYLFEHPKYGEYVRNTHQTLGMPKNTKVPNDGYWGHHWDAIAKSITGSPEAPSGVTANPYIDMSKLKGLPKFQYDIPVGAPAQPVQAPAATMRAYEQGDLSSDAQGLNPAGLAGEAYSLLTERVDPVLMQKYRPELEQPFQYSFQDQISAVDDTYRSALGYNTRNPQAQAALAAQASQQKRGILGEEFRVNQGESARVYNQNRQTMNDAQLRNLQAADRQYVRQSQARSNTKQNRFNALSSISEKYLQNQMEQNQLKVYENLYKYRYNDDYKIGYEGGQQQFNIPNVGPNSGVTPNTSSNTSSNRLLPISPKSVANATGALYDSSLTPIMQRRNMDSSLALSNDFLRNKYDNSQIKGVAKSRGIPLREAGGSITRAFKSFK